MRSCTTAISRVPPAANGQDRHRRRFVDGRHRVSKLRHEVAAPPVALPQAVTSSKRARHSRSSFLETAQAHPRHPTVSYELRQDPLIP